MVERLAVRSWDFRVTTTLAGTLEAVLVAQELSQQVNERLLSNPDPKEPQS